MPLLPGTKLGPYDIQSPLGEGGMGEVYCALDSRLQRRVAIKILASHLSSSPELKERLEREARAISALNHPHICHLYDIGSHSGTDYLVMELLEGETLAQRILKGALPLNQILKIGIEVADALAVAHRQGIIHRDLKPANIMLTAAGAKLMDFGLAKPLTQTAAVASGSPPSFTAVRTVSGASPLSPLTTAGSIVGTIQYMSPEQIEGKEADPRSDIFAFGAVLYEMASGKRPFRGKSQISLASSILESDPEPISVAQPLTPAAFEHVVTTCLQKSPDERYQTAHDIRLQLQWIASGKSGVMPALAPPSAARRGRERLQWAAALLITLVVGAAAVMLLYHPAKSAPSMRTVINPPEKTTLNLSGDNAGPPVLSPDGSTLAFTATADGKTSLWVRPMNSLEAHALADTTGAIFPFWSPDSRSLGFFADGKLKTIDISGSAALVICDAQNGRGGTWAPGGVILFTPVIAAPIMRVSASGGTPEPVTKVDVNQHTSHRWPTVLPDGQHFLYLALHHDVSKAANNTVFYASLDGKENRPLFRSQANAIYDDGFLLFARGDQLMAQSFDPAKGTLSGEPRILAKGVMNDPSTWHMDASANTGLLVFGSGGTGDLQLVWLDRATRQTAVVVDKVTNLMDARLSPQGNRVALQIDSGTNDIWVLDLARGVRTRLTFGPVANVAPVWSPDGQWIAYASPRNGKVGLYRRRSDGSGAEELLLAGTDQQIAPSSWSRDGKHLFYTAVAGGQGEVWVLPLDGDRKPSLVLAPGGEGQLSPDGHWLAYQSGLSGAIEIYVVPFGGGQGKWQVSPNGGEIPQWSRDGKELFFLDRNDTFSSVPVNYVNGAPQFGAVQTLPSTWSAPNAVFEVSPDSKKILFNRVAQQVSQSVTVVTNFTENLKK